jgi:multisubunit Na+/H+ antiporter MnhC subunit
MTAIVIGMVLIVIVALVVISVFADEDDDWSKSRPGRKDPDETYLDDLLGG